MTAWYTHDLVSLLDGSVAAPCSVDGDSGWGKLLASPYSSYDRPHEDRFHTRLYIVYSTHPPVQYKCISCLICTWREILNNKDYDIVYIAIKIERQSVEPNAQMVMLLPARMQSKTVSQKMNSICLNITNFSEIKDFPLPCARI